ncbi:hypothetical protein ABZ484_04440 [Streptomyces sp. NPDC006393]|uniref:hypothetical protein n=1 Tax=Streptomyces sp. NPDC006393 TaxID=3156763 RepID=UPI0033E73276
MDVVKDEGSGVVYAQLTGGDWLDGAGGVDRRMGALSRLPSRQRLSPAGSGRDVVGRRGRLRVVMTPVAALTVIVALLVGDARLNPGHLPYQSAAV